MRRYLAHAGVAAAVMALAACAQPAAPEGPSTEEMVASATALDEAFLDAFNRGDAEAIAALYWNSPDLVSFQPDVLVLRGMGEVHQGMTQFVATMQGASLEITESHQIPVGEAVVGWGLFRITLPSPAGAPMTLEGRYTDVKAERDGKWVYILDHASVPLPAPEPAAAP